MVNIVKTQLEYFIILIIGITSDMIKDETKCFLLIGAALLILYLIYKRQSTAESFEEEASGDILPANMEDIAPTDMSDEDAVSVESNGQYKNIPIPDEDMIKYFPQKDYAPPEDQWFNRKFNNRNKARRGEFKRSSYSGARRGNLGASNWDDYFDQNNNVIGNSQVGDNDNFLPIDETGGGFAVFKSMGRASCGSNQNCTPEQLYDVDKYLPQEVNDDWYEVLPEPISVKNRHLINITKPIGIDTIGTSLRNASHDLRAEYAVKKAPISPFLNSSIEPNGNIKPLF